ncbi:TPA: hypothetical protein QCU33_005807 [Bacillus cereus]|nr:hypothetical protein [Bacillus cereus]
MKIIIKFENSEELTHYLASNHNAQLLNISEGFEELERKILASSGTCSVNDIEFHEFNWIDIEEREIQFNVAFVYDVESGTDSYYLGK